MLITVFSGFLKADKYFHTQIAAYLSRVATDTQATTRADTVFLFIS